MGHEVKDISLLIPKRIKPSLAGMRQDAEDRVQFSAGSANRSNTSGRSFFPPEQAIAVIGALLNV